MKWITALIALGVLFTGCTMQNRTVEIYPQITGCPEGGGKMVTIDGVTLPAGNIIFFKTDLYAEVESSTDATNSPDVSPNLSIPLP